MPKRGSVRCHLPSGVRVLTPKQEDVRPGGVLCHVLSRASLVVLRMAFYSRLDYSSGTVGDFLGVATIKEWAGLNHFENGVLSCC
jgi:hypothetical protein